MPANRFLPVHRYAFYNLNVKNYIKNRQAVRMCKKWVCPLKKKGLSPDNTGTVPR